MTSQSLVSVGFDCLFRLGYLHVRRTHDAAIERYVAPRISLEIRRRALDEDRSGMLMQLFLRRRIFEGFVE
jgi:hypothetical protein